MSKFDFVGTCDICNKNVPKEDELRFVDDVFSEGQLGAYDSQTETIYLNSNLRRRH